MFRLQSQLGPQDFAVYLSEWERQGGNALQNKVIAAVFWGMAPFATVFSGASYAAEGPADRQPCRLRRHSVGGHPRDHLSADPMDIQEMRRPRLNGKLAGRLGRDEHR